MQLKSLSVFLLSIITFLVSPFALAHTGGSHVNGLADGFMHVATGLDHLLMARCNKIERATEILSLYQELAPAHEPILVHSEDSASARHLERLYSRDSRIVVCVEMLGEGFDLPQLKIAAIHDTHKSLAVLLQFTGRFTRTTSCTG